MSRVGKMALMIVTDAIALPCCFLAAMLLRLGDFRLLHQFGYWHYLYIPLVTLAVFSLSGLYRAVIRFIDRHLLTRTLVGLGIVVIISFFFVRVLGVGNQSLPRNALLIYWLLAFAYVLTSRLAVRSFLGRHASHDQPERTAVAIYGAGEVGMQIMRVMQADNKYRVAYFLDDKDDYIDRSVAGLRVFGTRHLDDLVQQTGIQQIVLAVPSASPKRRADILHALSKARLPVKTLGSVIELTNGRIAMRSIRDIQIEDLLGRRPVPPLMNLFSLCITGKNVLVTGAGGSIGSELCRQIATQSPAYLHLLDHTEYALYAIEQNLRSRFPALKIQAHLGSVCDERLVNRIMHTGQIDTVYHSAAYKHVPLVEDNMAEGIRNNVVGAQVIAQAAQDHKVATCVLISTDKAVRPTNVMGTSKRIAEMIFQAAAQTAGNDTTYAMVRFGNVLGSSGSVIPLFRHQLENGGPITLTHPDITRYFMLVEEAAQLVIQAGAMARGGEVFVLEMGEPVRIADMARTMIELAGLNENSSREKQHPDGIEIRYIGLRPGEKLYEELLINENAQPSDHPRIMQTSEHFSPTDVLTPLIERLLAACEQNNHKDIKVLLRTIVAEYSPQSDTDSEQDVAVQRLNSHPTQKDDHPSGDHVTV